MTKIDTVNNPASLEKYMAWLLALFVLVSFSGFFLLPSSKANSFPVYVVAILMILQIGKGLLVSYKSLVFCLFSVLLAYTSLSVFWSSGLDPSDIFSYFGEVLLVYLMLMAIDKCSRRYDSFISLLFKSIVALATTSVFVIEAQQGGRETVSSLIGGRLSTDTVAAIAYGFAMISACHLASNMSQSFERFVWSTCFLTLLYACYSLDTNYVWLAVVGSIVVVSVSKVWENRSSHFVFGWIASTICLMIAFLYLFDLVLVSERQLIWQSVVDVSYEGTPFFGSGALTEIVPVLDCPITSNLLNDFTNCSFHHAHNMYVSTMFHTGIVGLGLFLALLIVSFGASIESSRRERWLVLSLLGYGATVFLFDGSQYISKLDFVWMVFWLPVGLAYSMEMREAEETYRMTE
ncbi:hypothetical protein OAT01_10190 [Pseudomonadales bacterium]|nr:hypothetical protein [Pseudomonadales bacterium]